MTGGIYKIEHTSSGKLYVGSAVSLARRWRAHLSELRRGRHHSLLLQRAWDKYGEAEFAFSVLESVADSGALLTRENHWISAMGAADPARGYNICKVAGSQLGMRHTAEAKARMSATQRAKGKTPEHQQKINEALRGRSLSEGCKQKLSAGRLGSKLSAEVRQKMSETRRGKTASEESKKKISDKLRERHALARSLGLSLRGYAQHLREAKS